MNQRGLQAFIQSYFRMRTATLNTAYIKIIHYQATCSEISRPVFLFSKALLTSVLLDFEENGPIVTGVQLPSRNHFTPDLSQSRIHY